MSGTIFRGRSCMASNHISYGDVLKYYSGIMWKDREEVNRFRDHCSDCYQCAGKVADLDLDYPELLMVIPQNADEDRKGEHIPPIVMRHLFDNKLDDYERGDVIMHFINCPKCLREYMKLQVGWKKNLPDWEK